MEEQLMRTVTRVAVAGFILGAAACGHEKVAGTVYGSDGPPLSKPPVARIRLSPASDTVVVGLTVRLSAQALDSLGNTLSDRAMAWRSADTLVARVSDSGVVRGMSAGKISISASS